MHTFSLTLPQKTFLLSQYMRHSEEVCFTTNDHNNKGCRIGRRMVPISIKEDYVQMRDIEGDLTFKIEDIVFLPEYLLEDEDEDSEDNDGDNCIELNTAFYESENEWSISSISKDNSFYLNDSDFELEIEIELNA